MNKTLQVYAIIICVIAIITMLITLSNLVVGYIDKNDPMRSGWQNDQLASYETFKLETMKGIDESQVYIPDDEAIEEMYEAAKAEKLAKLEHRIHRDLVVNRLILMVAIVLFIIHWILFKKVGKSD